MKEETLKLKTFLKTHKNNFDILSNEPMKNHTSIKIGGPADLFFKPGTKDEFIDLINAAHNSNIPFTIIGDGTNLLVKDNGIRGLIISTTKFTQSLKTSKIDHKPTIITAPAGTKLATLCKYAIDNNLQGMEFAAGIPGTIGGAVKMNAGTPAGSISDILNTITIIADNGDIKKMSKNDLNFSYRALNNLNGAIIEASLILKSGDQTQIKKTFGKNLKYKKATQPLSLKSAGCIFKNPENSDPAGKLIDMAGLKGRKIGDAMVSKQHANFIVNLGNAKCVDVLNLKKQVEETILNTTSVTLETEIEIIGE